MPGLSQTILVFLVTDTQVLLGYKKSGFGQGKYVGVGGKIEVGETEIKAAKREALEEIGVTEVKLIKTAELSFLFPEKPNWSQQVHVFFCSEWEKNPQESHEIKPKWFNKTNLPFSHMWDDAQFWLPALLNGHTLQATFTFSSDLKVVEAVASERIFK